MIRIIDALFIVLPKKMKKSNVKLLFEKKKSKFNFKDEMPAYVHLTCCVMTTLNSLL